MGKEKNSRYVQKHGVVAFLSGAGFDEARAAAFDLNLAAGLLLDVLYVGTALSDDLSTQVKPGDGLQINWDALLRPFALYSISKFLVTVSEKNGSLIHGHTHLAPLARARGDGSVVHRLG